MHFMSACITLKKNILKSEATKSEYSNIRVIVFEHIPFGKLCKMLILFWHTLNWKRYEDNVFNAILKSF